jgi:precorrin-6B C5,15-methyltransferase / cobalt-precorrin-6B C5,C15-methyltransferase
MSRVTVVGLDGGPLREAALAALSRAALVIGWPEHVAAVRPLLPPRAEVRVIDRDLPATLDAVAASAGEVVVLTDGDPGFHGPVGALRGLRGDVAVVPAVTSVAGAFAAVGIGWEDAHLVSAHRSPPHHAIAVCRRFPKVAVLTGPALGPAELGAALVGLPRRLVVVEHIGRRGERVTAVDPAGAAARTWEDPNVVLVLGDDPSGAGSSAAVAAEPLWSTPPRWTPGSWALPGDLGGALAPAAAALALAWLGPGLGDLVWSVGPAGRAEALAAQAQALGAAALVAPGRPRDLADLPDPDAVVVCGGDHLHTEVVRSAADRVRRAVVVVLDEARREAPSIGALADAGLVVERAALRTAGAAGEELAFVVLRGSRR